MLNLLNYKTFESTVYDEDFNEYVVKNMLSDDVEKNQLWSLIADLLQLLKREHQLDLLSDFKNELMHDTRDNALKIAIDTALQLNDAEDILAKLWELKKGKQSVKNILKLRVKNILQAQDLKDILESKPWYNKVKIEGHNLLVDLKNNTVEEIKNLLQHLPFSVEMI